MAMARLGTKDTAKAQGHITKSVLVVNLYTYVVRMAMAMAVMLIAIGDGDGDGKP